MSDRRFFTLLALILLTSLTACSSKDGKVIYAKAGCGRCHSVDRSGTSSGPPLVNLSEHWSQKNLAAYLANPASFIENDPRLKAKTKEFVLQMPSFEKLLTQKEREALAKYLLSSP